MEENTRISTENEINEITDLVVPGMGQGISVFELFPKLNDLFRILMTKPGDHEDGVFRSPLIAVGVHLRECGIAQSDIKMGLLIYMVMLSARLGYPLSLILISEEWSRARDLLNACKQVVPQNAICEVQELKAEQLYRDQSYFANKVIVCPDLSKLKKAIPDLLDLIITGKTVRQEEVKGPFSHSMHSTSAEYTAALVGIEDPDTKSMFNHPSFITVRLDNGPPGGSVSSGWSIDPNGNTREIELNTLVKTFERLSYSSVFIPYLQPVVKAIVSRQPEDFKEKVEIIKKVISLCTIINNPPQVTRDEVFMKFVGSEITKVVQKSESRRGVRNLFPVIGQGLQAGKADYYLAALLLAETIGLGRGCFSRNEMEMFDIVKYINFAKAQMSMQPNSATSVVIASLPRNKERWAFMEEIMTIMNKGSKSFTSEPNVEYVLGKLKKLKVVGSRSSDSNKGDGYFILIPEIKSFLKLPKLSDLSRPDLQGPPTKIMNPITGEIDVI